MYRLDKNYRIEPDTNSWMLIEEVEYEKVDKKTKEPTGEIATKEDKWWFPSVNMCLKTYVDRLGRNEATLEEYITKVDALYKKINEMPKIFNK